MDEEGLQNLITEGTPIVEEFMQSINIPTTTTSEIPKEPIVVDTAEQDIQRSVEAQEELDRLEHLDAIELDRINQIDAGEGIKTHVDNNVSLVTEPEEEDTNGFVDVLEKIVYYKNEIFKGTIRGGLQAITTASSYIGDVTGMDTLKDYSKRAEDVLDAMLFTTSGVGEVGETVGRVGTGLFLTRGLGTSMKAYAGRGAITDFLAFSGDEGNIADMAKDFGFENELIEYLKTDTEDSETEKRLKNALTGAGVGASVDVVFKAMKYGKYLYSASGKTFRGSDEKLSAYVEDLVHKDAEAVIAKQSDAVDGVVTKPDDAITGIHTEQVAKEEVDNIVPKELPTEKAKVDVNEGIKLLNDAEDFIAGVKTDGVDLKQPLNAEKLAQGSETFAKATQDIDPAFVSKTFEETTQEIDNALIDKIGKESFDLMDDMMKTSKRVETLTTDLGQSRVIVGTLAKALDDSIKVAQRDNTVSGGLLVMQNLRNLTTASTLLKNTQSSIAQAMSSMRIDVFSAEMTGTLKLLDAIDPQNAMRRLEQAIGKDDMADFTKFMDELADTSKGLKDKVENIQDSLYKKITNSLSEAVVAGMLSAPSTLAVNVIGNSLVKAQSIVQDTAQFIWGQTLRGADRMALREYKYLMQSNVGQNFLDMKHITGNMLKWGKSGFKDEVFDDAVLVKFKQDQDFAHKYIDSTYWRGKEKGKGGGFNNAINIYGRLARSPYNVIGYVDDYYKRGAFRAELIRQGSRLADARKLSNKKYDVFMNKFIQANTELRLLTNQGKVPNKVWLNENKEFIGTGNGLTKYSDLATENANYMTFQKDLGEGFVGKSVKILNSDGLLRTMVPFKLTPINILKHSVSTATSPIKTQLYRDIAQGGVKRDIALAKISTSVGILSGLSALVTSGHMTGTFSKEERATMQSAGIPSLSYKIGNKWYEYKQVEPLATIAGVMADLHKLKVNLDYRLDDAEISGTLSDEYQAIMADLGMILVQNITDKTYAKSLAETLQLATGDQDLVDYSGKLLSSVTPMSSLTNYIGRITNEGFKKEAVTFSERIRSKYRVLLDRDALDSYGRPIKETDYLYNATIKTYDANLPENAGAREVARLGIELRKLPKSVSFKGFNTKLDEKQYWTMRRSMDKEFHLSDRLNYRITTRGYLEANDFTRKQILEGTIRKIRQSAQKAIFRDKKIVKKIVKKADLVKAQIARPKEKRTTYNDLIIEKVR